MRAIEGETCEASWLAAAQYLLGCHGHEQHNLIVEVAQPTQHSPQDRRIRVRIDNFLRNHEADPQSVLFRLGGSPTDMRRSIRSTTFRCVGIHSH